MEIKPKLEQRTVFSPWGRKLSPFLDVDRQGKEFRVPRGTSLPELARLYYGVTKVEPFSGNYPFLDRDHKDRSYSPAKDDPFVFAGPQSLTMFMEEATKLTKWLTDKWQEHNLPVKDDPKRGFPVPDTSSLLDPESLSTADLNYVKDNYEELAFITANFDICRKFCVVRGIIPGWWASSYAGKETANPKDFEEVIDIMAAATRVIRSSPAFSKAKQALTKTMGDPLYSNVGYPFFVSTVDARGVPLARLAVLDLFRSVGTQGWNWEKVVNEIDARGRKLGLGGYPFAVAPIRRQQYGDKDAHDFVETSWGLQTNVNFSGYNTVRIAFIVPYIFNLYISPIAADLKATRMLLPGGYNDGPIMKNRAVWMREGKLFMAEGDYSNYDRSMPYPLIMEKFNRVYKNEKHFKYWQDMMIHSYKRLPLIWPDYLPGARGRGHVFYPGALGLLSGMKPTTEIGSDANLIIGCNALLNSGIMNRKKLMSYLTQYASGKAPGSMFEYLQVQSDDALLLSRDFSELMAFGKAFKKSAAAAGVPLKFEIGDRYLMRSSYAGRNAPVPARIWQNTLSNEDPYIDPLKFIVGLASRTDGLLGYKTVDPFNNGKHRSITEVEREFTELMLESILKFLKSAAKPVSEAIAFTEILLQASRTGVDPQARRWKMSPEFIPIINEKRSAYIQALAKQELKLINDRITIEMDGQQYSFMKPKSLETLFMGLRSNAYSLSSAIVLDELVSESEDYANALNFATEVENQFYLTAMSKVGIPLGLE